MSRIKFKYILFAERLHSGWTILASFVYLERCILFLFNTRFTPNTQGLERLQQLDSFSKRTEAEHEEPPVAAFTAVTAVLGSVSDRLLWSWFLDGSERAPAVFRPRASGLFHKRLWWERLHGSEELLQTRMDLLQNQPLQQMNHSGNSIC